MLRGHETHVDYKISLGGRVRIEGQGPCLSACCDGLRHYERHLSLVAKPILSVYILDQKYWLHDAIVHRCDIETR